MRGYKYVARCQTRGSEWTSAYDSFDAVLQQVHEMRRNVAAKVDFFEVGEDGTETPLPTYEEALAQLELADNAFDALKKAMMTRTPYDWHVAIKAEDAYRNARGGAFGYKVFDLQAELAELRQIASLARKLVHGSRRCHGSGDSGLALVMCDERAYVELLAALNDGAEEAK